MMTVFTSAVTIALYGLFRCRGPIWSRLDSLRPGALLGSLYTAGPLVATLAMPAYGGSLYWQDNQMRAATLGYENLIVFSCTTIIFTILLVMLYRRSEELK